MDLVQWQTDPALGPRWARYVYDMTRAKRKVTMEIPEGPQLLPGNREAWRAWSLVRRHRQRVSVGFSAVPAGLDWPAVATRLEVAGLWRPDIAEALAVCETTMLHVEQACRERDGDEAQ
jgi:hypothetical protein